MALIFASFCGPSVAAGSAILTIAADIDGALVVMDGAVAGRTPLTMNDVAPGMHQIRVLHPDLESWVSPVITDSIQVADGEVRNLNYRFSRSMFVMTQPSGAEVLLGNSIAGTTPLVIEARNGDSLMQVRMHGFRTVAIDPTQAERGVIRIQLDRSMTGIEEGTDVVATTEGRSSLPLFLSGASSIIAGGFSAYFKVQADRVYNEYLLTGDPVKLAETRKLDSVAGIALGASQVYFALFSYLLLSQ
jgi:hypothetical protein